MILNKPKLSDDKYYVFIVIGHRTYTCPTPRHNTSGQDVALPDGGDVGGNRG